MKRGSYRAGWLGTIIFLICFWGSAAGAGNLSGEIALDCGRIQGQSDNGLWVYRGIPYGAPPTGELRWKPPQPVSSWQDVRRCTAFGPACPQPQQTPGDNYSEDCLYLNVWAPEKTGEKLPVMVWFHGGAFNFGAASLPEYDGAHLARQGVVVVTVNYRLGPLGFFVHPLLDQESPQGVSGNYGLLDQIAALKWVQRNIAAFGGNPDQVTIFGQSAGSRSVSLQMISPLSEGLFHRAIAESGGPIIGSEYLSPAFNGNLEQVREMGKELSARLGCAGISDELTALRACSAQEVVKAAACSTGLFDKGLFFAPVFDGWVLPPNPLTAYQEGKRHPVPLIAGSTGNEGMLYLVKEKEVSADQYNEFIDTRFGPHGPAAREMFPLEPAGARSAIDKMITVGANGQPARMMVASAADQGCKSYLYHFRRVPDTALARQAGAHHGVDLAYVFGNMEPGAGYKETDMGISQLMMGYWVNFAKTGSPNGPGLPYWPPYQRDTDISLDIADSVTVTQHLYRQETDFIESVGDIWR